MSAKRKETGGEQPENRKKQRLNDARTIPVQSNTEAGPSTVGNGVRRLGGAIDVEKFVEARKFEINAMQVAQKTARGAATQRVWQTLPRHLRRRAASHDVRRVPLRLRDRAKQEMTAVKKKALARFRPKQGKDKRLSRTETFIKRQRDKSWLETHIWHAKRMKMQNMWGYRLAVTPTEKAFRPSHRASARRKLSGLYSTVAVTFKVPRPARNDTSLEHGRSTPISTNLPRSENAEAQAHPPTEEIQSQKHGKGKGKAKAPPENSDSDTVQRTVWIRSHPAISENVFVALRTSASLVLAAARKAAPQGTQIDEIGIALEDLSGQINAFEIMGPKSNQVLKGAISPASHDSREDFNKFWASMMDLQTSGSIPRGMVIGFKALDPRLKFPPKNAKPRPTSTSPIIIPSASLAQSDLWDESTRDGLRKPRYKKKDLDERRSKNLIPGTHLSPLRQDDRVPVLLIQRSVERSTSSKDLAIHGWTLLLPAGWSMPFFSSLTFTGTRVAGQRERQTQAFEAGTGYFPRDYPFCASYEAYAAERAEEEQARWARTPPAKRANYEKLGTRSPWRADWSVVLGIETPAPALVSTQREAGDTAQAEKVQPWLLRGSTVRALVERLMGVDATRRPAIVAEELNTLRAKRNLDPSKVDPDALLRGALVRVRITPCTRGNPQDLALIYVVDDAEAQAWRHMPRKSQATGEESEEEQKFTDAKPPQTSIIGYVTTGNFSLSHGEGFAIGAVPLRRFLEVGEQARRFASKELLVKVRDRDGHKCRAAHIELLDV
ncbi:Ribonucleases P/MRP protein subunit POP1 [Mycena sanguinolenta]|uniref:Ribonucleases P/MRP protein subunit POP1 n=1 Tax=Mycena sanguinolenta TaxID=230812 RepID=A0A8H7CQA6_9AGAR|nr:Ribonucleases P/MRP protein subunit POP1 [Mycena sanguinolenta]